MVGGQMTLGAHCRGTLISGTSMQGLLVGGGATQGAWMLGMTQAGGETEHGCSTHTCELTSKLGWQPLVQEVVVVEPQPQLVEVPVASTSPRTSKPKTIFFIKIITLTENLPINNIETLNFRISLYLLFPSIEQTSNHISNQT